MGHDPCCWIMSGECSQTLTVVSNELGPVLCGYHKYVSSSTVEEAVVGHFSVTDGMCRMAIL